MVKIVKGNDVKLQFPFFERLDKGYLVPLDMNEVTNLEVKFIRSNGDEIVAESGVSVTDNYVVVVIPCYTEIGKYHVSISGMLGNAHVCSVLKDCFSIVQFNSDGNFTEKHTAGDTVIDASVLLRVNVDEHTVPSTDDEEDGDDTDTDTGDNGTETPSDGTSTDEPSDNTDGTENASEGANTEGGE